jgi:uncharacterized protein YjeT (DUF2065 family)
MAWIILIAAHLSIAFYLLITIVPTALGKIITFFSIGSRLYLLGLLRLALGIMLLALAAHSRLWGYVIAVGLILAASGLSLFFFALRRTKKLLLRLQSQTNPALRLFALIALAIWAVLIYALVPALPASPLR